MAVLSSFSPAGKVTSQIQFPSWTLHDWQHYNFSHWSNKQYDDLIKASKGTDANSETKRYDDLLKAQELLSKESPVATLYQTVQGHLRNPKLKGATFSPANMYNFVGAYMAK